MSAQRPSGGGRPERVAERIRAELGDMLLRGALGDPAAQGAVVSAVRVSGDLSVARVYVRTLEAASARRQQALVEAFERGAGRLRRRLAARLQLRRAPELRFHWDDVVDSAGRIEGLLDSIARDAPDGEGA
ncbi:MAG: 30S ribosome-binding factor RbfA [Myxococcota bacterium]